MEQFRHTSRWSGYFLGHRHAASRESTTKGTPMKTPLLVGAAALALAAAGAVGTPSNATSLVPLAAQPAVVTISVQGDQAMVSPSTVRPGVVEFRVGDTFTIPGPEGGPDQLSVLATDQLDVILAALPAVFGGDPTDPAVAAGAAQAMRTIHGAGTFYGGANKGMSWQVTLPAGNFTVMGVQSTAMGMAKPATFTVAGEPRQGALHATQATVRAIGPVGNNKWAFTQRGSQPIEWLRFANSAKELHFLDMSGVKPSTTPAMVRKALQSNGNPKFFTGQSLSFDVISPGVTVAIKGPVDAGRYLLDCFIPSETDGMPHALMGMWKLVDVK